MIDTADYLIDMPMAQENIRVVEVILPHADYQSTTTKTNRFVFFQVVREPTVIHTYETDDRNAIIKVPKFIGFDLTQNDLLIYFTNLKVSELESMVFRKMHNTGES